MKNYTMTVERTEHTVVVRLKEIDSGLGWSVRSEGLSLTDAMQKLVMAMEELERKTQEKR